MKDLRSDAPCSWHKFEPGVGQFANYFRIVTPSQNVGLYSRPANEPTFSNAGQNYTYSDQHFCFLWEDMEVEKVEFNLDSGRIISSTPIVLAEQVLTNNSDTEQEMSFSVNKSVTNTSTFEYSTGFTVTVGMEFSGVSNPVHRPVCGTVP